MVGGQIGTAQDKSGQGFQGTFFLPFFASDFKIERNIPIRKEWLKAWFQENVIARFQYFKKEWKKENKIEIKQSFNISRLQYGNKESYMAGLIESNK